VLSIDAGEPVLVQGHPQLLAQAIANLVDNAIKYTPEGGRVALATGSQPQPFVRVVDNGPGIPAELRERALERFVRLQPERSTPGNGLGLSLVSAVASLHGATLELGNAEPGLAITMRIPAAKLDKRPGAPPLVNPPD
jgi:signal transduction histidine kinase